MIGELPKALEVGGKMIEINSDFRVALQIFQAFNDEELTDMDKAVVCVKLLFKEEIPMRHFEEAVKKAYWFLDGGDIQKSEPRKAKMIDWEHDQSIIFPAANKAAGYELRDPERYTHFWTFLGYFGEIGEGLFSTVMSIRRKINEGKSLEKWEQDFLKKNKKLIVLRTPEEQAAIDETEAFLKTLI